MDQQNIVASFSKLDTPCVSDAMDRLGIKGGLLGIKSVVPGSSFCGSAFTVHYTPCGEVRGNVGDFLDDVQKGQVVVIDNAGRNDCTVWGDLMTITANRNKIAGTVIDGVCRDVPAIRDTAYPIFTKGCYMVTGKDRVYVDGVNIPISISDVQVKSGDILIGDDSGVLVVPQEYAEKVLIVSLEIETKEQQIMDRINRGETLKDARASVGYHSLQTRSA
jgi:regulator of RNase E activity RraA